MTPKEQRIQRWITLVGLPPPEYREPAGCPQIKEYLGSSIFPDVITNPRRTGKKDPTTHTEDFSWQQSALRKWEDSEEGTA